MAFAEDFFHNLRDGHVLIDCVLVRAVKQRQTGLQRQGVQGLILRSAQPFESAHHALDHPHRLLDLNAETLIDRGQQRQRPRLHQHHVFADAVVGAGEFNAVAERLAQGFKPFKGQHVQRRFTPFYRKPVMVVAEDDFGVGTHDGSPLPTLNVSAIPCSSLQPKVSSRGFWFAAIWLSSC
ncbi:hypothetical protein D3C75_517470 [compost metagenome]